MNYERILWYLQAYYDINFEVLEAEQKTELLTLIAQVMEAANGQK